MVGDKGQCQSGTLGRPEKNLLDHCGTGIRIYPYFHGIPILWEKTVAG
jgi:hypothetical protein